MSRTDWTIAFAMAFPVLLIVAIVVALFVFG